MRSWLTHHGKGGYYSCDENYSGMGDNGSGGNSPNDFDASGTSDQSGGHSSGFTEEMQKQIQVKDKVITELAGIVELLEINYGISIDHQTRAFHDFVNIARSMEAEAREAGNAASSSMTKGNYHRECTFTRG